MWDYLRRSGASGFFLAFSGGADSAAVAIIVAIMCRRVFEAASIDEQIRGDICRIVGLSNRFPSSEYELVSALLHTAYMGLLICQFKDLLTHETESCNSLIGSQRRAGATAAEIGASHLTININSIVASFLSIIFNALSMSLRYFSQGGSRTEDLALQNIQARIRMVTSFLLAQLLPTATATNPGGFLLVLCSANVDETLRGYMWDLMSNVNAYSSSLGQNMIARLVI